MKLTEFVARRHWSPPLVLTVLILNPQTEAVPQWPPILEVESQTLNVRKAFEFAQLSGPVKKYAPGLACAPANPKK